MARISLIEMGAASPEVKEIYEKTGRSGPMVFIVISSMLRKQNGEVAVRVDYRFTNPM